MGTGYRACCPEQRNRDAGQSGPVDRDAEGVHELRVALDRTTWRLTFWKPSNKVIVVLTVFRKTQDGTQTADIDRAIAAKKRCEAEHDLTITHVFERSA
ncbi:type II toxin-antitoxin system RelE/ParE family toxin [Sphaerisporangium sp. NPDC051011]|uniref:type II toxin-antitoxin system RelE/ParE family toxin n=1 Tax=Sphaerisporangium sp. NPDC051011 TaxID=3155792 RepID=UPI00340E0DC0